MPVTTLSGPDFEKDPESVMETARQGPVMITNDGQPAYALDGNDDDRRLSGGIRRSLVDALAMPGLAEVDLTFSKVERLARPADFT